MIIGGSADPGRCPGVSCCGAFRARAKSATSKSVRVIMRILSLALRACVRDRNWPSYLLRGTLASQRNSPGLFSHAPTRPNSIALKVRHDVPVSNGGHCFKYPGINVGGQRAN